MSKVLPKEPQATPSAPELEPEERDWIDKTIAYLKTHRLIWIPIIIVALIGGYFAYGYFSTAEPLDTDPTGPNQPLSNPEQHLHTLAIDPLQPGVVYLGSHFGLFTSTDDGRSWPQPRGQLNTLMITALAPSTLNKGTIGIVGIAPSGGDFGRNGIYFTHDGGQHWQRANDPAGVPKDTNRFLVAPLPTSTHDWVAIYVGQGLYATHDDGKTWKLLRAPASDQEAQNVVWTSAANPHAILLGSNLGLVRSLDDGATWTPVTSVAGGIEVAVSPAADPQTVYVATDQGIFRSQDGGMSFTLMSGNIAPDPFTRLAASAQNRDVLYGLAGQQVWRSADGGTTWVQQTTLTTTYPMALLVAPDNDQHVYVGFYAPPIAMESQDGGKNWSIIAR